MARWLDRSSGSSARTLPPLNDFVSNLAQGRPYPNQNPETIHLWDGLSTYDRESRARRKAKGMPWLGQRFIAEIRIDEDDPCIRFERTTRSDGHYTIWGDHSAILANVIRVTPIRTAQPHEEPV